MTSNDPLLQPYQLRHLTLKNRIMSTSHEPAYSEDGMPKERYRLYHAEKARGGMALTMTAGSAIVSRDSPAAFGNLHAYDDAIVPWMAELADACHEHDCKVMIQLTHLGRRTAWNKADWLPVLSASPVREAAHRTFPKTAEDWDLDRIVGDYASAAQRMQAAGLDGIEFEAYGHLLDGFWSPATNHRDDVYGGSLDNRLRFTWRVIDAVRAAVGPDFLVGIRMVADEDFDKGLSRQEGVEIARRLASSGKFDFLNIIRGHIDTDAALTGVIPIHGMPSSPHLDFAGDIRAATKFPVFHAARIADVATARHAIASGKLDMVGMTRAHIADPHITAKVMAGEEHRIRPCVGATYCLDRIYEGGGALCIHNAATGREATIPHVIARTDGPLRRTVVVGAGAAGLEAARVLAERGHKVTVLEAASQAGGQIRLAAQNPRRRELIGIVDWRLAELERLGVEIRYDIWAGLDDVLALDPDAVVIATGGLPQNPPLDGGDELVTSSWDIIAGSVKPAENVLLYDDNGGHQGMTAAELIGKAGSRLELLTPERFFAPEIGGMNHVPYMEAFHRHGVKITINTRLKQVRRDGNQLVATLVSDFAKGWSEERRVDQVVVEHGTLPLDELYLELKPLSKNSGAIDYTSLIHGGDIFPDNNPDGRFLLLRIGDAVQARNIHAAIYDGIRFGLRI
ncbi:MULTISPECIES: NADH:flavin oxidoreductase [Aminobacter]|uniref:2,4-dienoyl-CoA reductase-like NADH-dependent reductase (Old Yellow Enzyme family)/thioredoxin reductase n=1 Tax=Aminobacter ciceronei TaxID=150723 RepID=A0ABR6C2R9_9HYPH|nr:MULTISPECIES: NADH:flavin oxidoreductase [Aminobacter]MBA8905409.1 2,4-dienoyl-CoA reductase-like NADH-dependent reductase (Old Yellow Enzyme family)/thioredoxin reductase [Aminobacter ciceronei]MBA9019291.1 2,4-dienoyl-CoA reductase-like NADH-dependent reductase (Old Yellow Enzyme family)/thioredoxin reductase [Aminobacter ciceronei]MRX34073.1 NAD(P)-binding protein [Aminobacter sp. MDW-2]QNH33125.1 NADH:flavin oxidoreductase [Aminobacter sp. MDW-2]